MNEVILQQKQYQLQLISISNTIINNNTQQLKQIFYQNHKQLESKQIQQIKFKQDKLPQNKPTFLNNTNIIHINSCNNDQIEINQFQKQSIGKHKNGQINKEKNEQINKEKNEQINKEKNQQINKEKNEQINKEKNEQINKEKNQYTKYSIKQFNHKSIQQQLNNEQIKQLNNQQMKQQNNEIQQIYKIENIQQLNMKNKIYVFSDQQDQIQNIQYQHPTSRRQLNNKLKSPNLIQKLQNKEKLFNKIQYRIKKNVDNVNNMNKIDNYTLQSNKKVNISNNTNNEYNLENQQKKNKKLQFLKSQTNRHNKKYQNNINHHQSKQQQYQQSQQTDSQDQQQEQQFQQQKQQKKQNYTNKQNEIIEQNKYKNNKSTYILRSTSYYTLINAQIPQNNFINCIIKRKRSNNIFDTIIDYQCYLLQDQKYLISCIKNRLFKTTSHFQFYKSIKNTINKSIPQQNIYGLLNSNITGSQFVFKSIIKHDSESQKSTAVDKNQFNKQKIQQSSQALSDHIPKHSQTHKVFIEDQRKINLQSNIQYKQTAYFNFKNSLFGLTGQRQVKVLKKNNKKLIKHQQFSDLKIAQQNYQTHKYSKFTSKRAIKGKNGLELDFKGNAKMQSTKNIVLQNDNNSDVLILGKVKQDIFCVSVGHPFSIMEGLAFSIANLDRKYFLN